MLVSFLESIRYVGHLYPLAFLRIYLGYYYLQAGIGRVQNDYISPPELANLIHRHLPVVEVPGWYRYYLEQIVVSNWQMFTYALISIEIFIGLSYLLGYLVRFSSLLALIVVIHLMTIAGPERIEVYQLLFAVHLALAWVGAGRCLGIDYYFFKRRRGLWW